MNKFVFADSSGIMRQDRFFGAGVLVVRNVGDMIDKLAKNSQPAYSLLKQRKQLKIDDLIRADKRDEVIKILQNNSKFEMKFDNVRTSLQPYYERMIDIFLSDGDNRFSAMVMDKNNPLLMQSDSLDAWESYTDYAANLVIMEMQSSPEDSLCVIVDELTRPRTKPLSLEDTVISKIRNKATSDRGIDINKIFGSLSIESHSNLLMQLSDLLLGAVMYDFKKDNNLATPKMTLKKERLVQKVRSVLSIPTLANNLTVTQPVFFKVQKV